ncbi:Alpha/Beta hydrolase protein [Neurospora crassa]|nr:Alpha/Beta hydrolase protein [Neurospora crassa]
MTDIRKDEFSFDKVDEDPKGFFYAPPGYTDHTFKSSSGVELGVRVWPAENVVQDPAPIVFWTHGGGFLGGHHFVPLPWLTPGFRKCGYHLVSHNYRLAPQAALDHQVADCIEAIEWCRKNLPSILGEGKADVDRYVLVGESAGGTLVTLMGLHLTSPPPRVIVNVYGLVDISPFVNMPDRTPEPWRGKFTDEEVERFINDRGLNNVLTDACCWNEQELFSEEELRKRWAANIQYDKRFRLQAEAHQWRSVRALPGDIHKAFLHSDADEPVPIQQSYDMVATLRERGVPVIERYEEGEPHVFDIKYTDGRRPFNPSSTLLTNTSRLRVNKTKPTRWYLQMADTIGSHRVIQIMMNYECEQKF